MEKQLTKNEFETLDYLETHLTVIRLATKVGSANSRSEIKLWDWLFMFDSAERISFIKDNFEAEIQAVLDHQKFFSKNFGGYLAIANCIELAEENYKAARIAAKRTVKIFSYFIWATLAIMIVLFFTTFSDFNFAGLTVTAVITFLILISVDGNIYLYQIRKCQVLKITADILRLALEKQPIKSNS